MLIDQSIRHSHILLDIMGLDIMGLDIMGLDIMGIDIMGLDILGQTPTDRTLILLLEKYSNKDKKCIINAL